MTLRAELLGRVFGARTGACLLERDGARLRATGPDRAFADLPETGPVWVSWAQADALPLED